MNVLNVTNARNPLPSRAANRPAPPRPAHTQHHPGSVGAMISAMQAPDEDILPVEALNPYAIPGRGGQSHQPIVGPHVRQPPLYQQQATMGHRHLESAGAGRAVVSQFLMNTGFGGGRGRGRGRGGARGGGQGQWANPEPVMPPRLLQKNYNQH